MKRHRRTPCPSLVYSDDAVDQFIRGKRGDLAKRLPARIEHQAGSDWSLKGDVGLVVTTHTEKPSMGSSFFNIHTPQTSECIPEGTRTTTQKRKRSHEVR